MPTPNLTLSSAPRLSLAYHPLQVDVGEIEPSRFVTQKTGTVLLHEDGSSFVPIGEFALSVVDVASARGHASLGAIFDSVSEGFADVYRTLYGRQPPRFKAAVRRVATEMCGDDFLWNLNVLVLERFELDKDHRGHGHGLRALEALLRAESASFGLVVLNAYPLQYEGVPCPNPAQLKRDTRALSRHYAKLGFKTIPRTAYMMLAHERLWSTRPH